jgi:hypothetical protein
MEERKPTTLCEELGISPERDRYLQEITAAILTQHERKVDIIDAVNQAPLEPHEKVVLAFVLGSIYADKRHDRSSPMIIIGPFPG